MAADLHSTCAPVHEQPDFFSQPLPTDQHPLIDKIVRLKPCILKLLRRQGFPRDIASDAAQQAVLKALLWLRQGGTIANLGPWLRRTAENAAREILRRERRGGGCVSIHDVEEPPLSDDHSRLVDLRDLIQHALSGLEPTVRDIVVFCYMQGGTIPEAAHQFGLCRRTIDSRLAKARLCLAQLLADSIC